MIKIKFYNYTDVYIDTNYGIHIELSNHFKFRVPNYIQMKKFNKRLWKWDGYIRQYNIKKNTLPYGLIDQLIKFCKENNYEYILDPKIKKHHKKISKDKIDDFIDDLNLPYELRPYQRDAIYKVISKKHCGIISATSSGKSYIIYSLVQWCLQKMSKKILIIVPTTALLHQMEGDFLDYGNTEPIYKIMAGVNKNEIEGRIVISTWQSLYKQPKKYFDQFCCVIQDELHIVKNGIEAKSVSSLLEKCTKAVYKMGCTGTLSDEMINKKQIEAIFGPIYKIISPKELIKNGFATPLHIYGYLIQYPKEIKRRLEKMDWNEQIQFIENIKNPRNEIIINKIKSLKENTIVMFRNIEHGKYLHDRLAIESGKDVYYIDGSVPSKKRNEIRLQFEKSNNVLLVGSYQTMSTGINMKNLYHLVFTSSYKSQIKILQSLGRMMRKHKNKNKAYIHDFCDDYGLLKKHYETRLEMYVNEALPYQEEYINLKKDE